MRAHVQELFEQPGRVGKRPYRLPTLHLLPLVTVVGSPTYPQAVQTTLDIPRSSVKA